MALLHNHDTGILITNGFPNSRPEVALYYVIEYVPLVTILLAVVLALYIVHWLLRRNA